MENLHFIDLLMMVVYFAVVLWIGLAVMRSKKERGESESFLAADRNMNLWQTTGSTAATDLGGGFSIAMGGLGFTMGISGSFLITFAALSIICAAFFMVPKVKRWADRCKGLTTGDMFADRFDERVGLVAAVLVGLAWFTFVGGQIIAGGKLLQATMHLDLTLATVIAGSIVLAYTMMGGLKAVIYTDVFQMVILLIGIVFIMVPVGLYKVGGWQAMVEHFMSNENTASMVSWGTAGWKNLAGWFFSVFPMWFYAITGIQRIIAARDEKTAKLAFVLTGIPFEWPLFAIGTTFVGMFARMLMPEIADAELATPTMIAVLLPKGLAGIVIAAYIAAIMSTADSCLIGPVAIFVNDIYHKRIRQTASDQELVKIARWTTFIMGTLAIGAAYMVPSVLKLVMYAYTFGAAGLFMPTLGLLFWKQTTAAGALWSIILGGLSAVIWTIAGEPWGFSGSYLGWLVSFLALVFISLNTQHHPEEDINAFI